MSEMTPRKVFWLWSMYVVIATKRRIFCLRKIPFLSRTYLSVRQMPPPVRQRRTKEGCVERMLPMEGDICWLEIKFNSE